MTGSASRHIALMIQVCNAMKRVRALLAEYLDKKEPDDEADKPAPAARRVG